MRFYTVSAGIDDKSGVKLPLGYSYQMRHFLRNH